RAGGPATEAETPDPVVPAQPDGAGGIGAAVPPRGGTGAAARRDDPARLRLRGGRVRRVRAAEPVAGTRGARRGDRVYVVVQESCDGRLASRLRLRQPGDDQGARAHEELSRLRDSDADPGRRY